MCRGGRANCDYDLVIPCALVNGVAKEMGQDAHGM